MKNSKTKLRLLPKDGLSKTATIVILTVLIIYTLMIFFMLGWGLFTSLKSGEDFLYNENYLGFPTIDGAFNSKDELFKLKNYLTVFEKFRITSSNHSEAFSIFFGTKERITTVDADFSEMLVNSLLYSIGNAVIKTMTVAVTAYVCAKYAYKFSNVMYGIVVVTMALPIVGAYPGEISLLRDLGLYDTWIGNFIQKTSFIGMFFLVFFEYFKSQSNTYKEAAEIDGASQFMVMTKIYMPMAFKTIGAVVLVLFIQFWNDYSNIRMYMRTHPTLSYGVFYNTIALPMAGGLPVIVASCMIIAIPILILFIVLQKPIMGSMTLGGIKE